MRLGVALAPPGDSLDAPPWVQGGHAAPWTVRCKRSRMVCGQRQGANVGRFGEGVGQAQPSPATPLFNKTLQPAKCQYRSCKGSGAWAQEEAGTNAAGQRRHLPPARRAAPPGCPPSAGAAALNHPQLAAPLRPSGSAVSRRILQTQSAARQQPRSPSSNTLQQVTGRLVSWRGHGRHSSVPLTPRRPAPPLSASPRLSPPLPPCRLAHSLATWKPPPLPKPSIRWCSS